MVPWRQRAAPVHSAQLLELCSSSASIAHVDCTGPVLFGTQTAELGHLLGRELTTQAGASFSIQPFVSVEVIVSDCSLQTRARLDKVSLTWK